MFQFTAFASRDLWIQSRIPQKGGFPHSDIFGSKLVCQLPEAFRRLPRPSSPVIAKASTTCTCSLDPITGVSLPIRSSRFSAYCGPIPEGDRDIHRECHVPHSLQVEYSCCAVFQSNLSITFSYIDTITTLIHLLTHPSLSAFSESLYYFFLIVKERQPISQLP